MQSPITEQKMNASRGFSFVELMFAVVVLGIGFIMIAAVFPVGLQQVKTSLDESAAAANARGAVATIQQVAQTTFQYTNFAAVKDVTNSTSMLPVTLAAGTNVSARVPVSSTVTIPGEVRSLRDPRSFFDAYGDPLIHNDTIWNRLALQFLNSSDDRNGFVFLYKRDLVATKDALGNVTTKPASSAQLIIVNAQATTHSNFVTGTVAAGGSAGDVLAPTASKPTIYNLEPRPVLTTVTYDYVNGIYIAKFGSVSGMATFPSNTVYDNVPLAIAEGTYLVISDDQITAPPEDIGRLNGRIFKIGVQRSDLGTGYWQLAPGYDFSPDQGGDGAYYNSTATTGAAGSFKDDIPEIGVNGSANTINAIKFDGTNVTVNTTTNAAIAYVVGRGFDNLAATPGQTGKVSTYSAPAQDIAIYTTFINVP